MPRLCFVIMPFSGTASCSEEEWTGIFEKLIKPSVEGAGLDYECRRSEANRGNLISAIVRSLHEAHVVLADLTDQSPNVFYELGVRHALRNRTILVAQDRENLPFDLRAYANHVYDWKSDKGRQKFTANIKELLEDVDVEPDRPDNPVSDFLTEIRRPATPPRQREAQELAQPDEPLTGPKASPGRCAELGRSVSRQRDLPRLRALIREARRYFREAWPHMMEEMDGEQPNDASRIEEKDMMSYAMPFIERFEADIQGTESFALGVVESGWSEGVRLIMPIVGDWLTIAEQRQSSRFKAIQGAPSVCSLRLLSLMGTKGFADEAFPAVRTLLFSSIESLEIGGTLSTLPLVSRQELLHPNGLFGLADLATNYLRDLFARISHIQPFFLDESDYHRNLGWFLLMWGLGYDSLQDYSGYPLYAGYKLLPGTRTALEAFSERLSAEPEFLQGIASILDETAGEFSERWRKRAERQNSSKVGSKYFFNRGGHLREDVFEPGQPRP